MNEWTGQTIAGRYRLQGRLGRSARGAVYRAHDEILGRQVAIKLFRNDDDDAMSAECFRREAQVVARLQHPRIVPIYDFGTWHDLLYFTMPIVPGESLRQVLKRGPLRPAGVAELGAQLAEALDYSHGLGIVHRDLKPENVMVSWTERGRPVISLLDFGIAHEIGTERQTIEQIFRGTALYASPEQLSDDPVDARCDIWSLGVVVYECLAGRSPFRAGRLEAVFFKILTADPPPLGLDGMAGHLEAVCLECLQRERAARPQTMAEVLRRLPVREAAAGRTVSKRTLSERDGLERDGLERVVPGRVANDDDGDRVEPTIEITRPWSGAGGGAFDWTQLGDRLLVQGDFPAAQQAYDAARREQGDGPNAAMGSAASGLGLALLAMKLGRYEEALRRCDLCVERADDPALRAHAETLATLIELAAGNLAAAEVRFEDAKRQLARVDPSARESGLVAAVLRARGNLWLSRGEPQPALDAFQHAVETLESAVSVSESGASESGASESGASSERSIEDRWELSIQLYNVAEAAHRLGDLELARRSLDRAEALKVALGDRWGLASVHLLRALLGLETGRLDRARHDAGLGSSIAEAIGDPKIIARSLLVGGRVQSARGQFEAARALFRRALEVAEAAGCRPEADEAIGQLQAPDDLVAPSAAAER